MTVRATSGLGWPSPLRTLISNVRVVMRLLREPRVPPLIKALPVLTAFYVISPLDVMPDFLPILGQLDDLGVVLVALGAFFRLCPAAVVDFHRAAVAQGRKYSPMPSADNAIDAEFHREDDGD